MVMVGNEEERAPIEDEDAMKRQIRKSALWAKEFAPGFIGGKEVAEEATIEEVEWLVELGNGIARMSGEISESEKMRDNLIRAIKQRAR